ncbi:hypothetical protein BDZ91DRAFT_788327 [Kalaharituber pfeilii]|nr:hypothetical protein BDZ91DRAFT_788327 [Kalaharituber pfeilii]
MAEEIQALPRSQRKHAMSTECPTVVATSVTSISRKSEESKWGAQLFAMAAFRETGVTALELLAIERRLSSSDDGQAVGEPDKAKVLKPNGTKRGVVPNELTNDLKKEDNKNALSPRICRQTRDYIHDERGDHVRKSFGARWSVFAVMPFWVDGVYAKKSATRLAKKEE